MTGHWDQGAIGPPAAAPGPRPVVPGAPTATSPASDVAPAEGAAPPQAPPAASSAAPHALLGTGLRSYQARFVSSGVATRMRVDVHDGWLAITGVVLPRRWRKAVQIGLFAMVFVIVVDLLLVRPLWSAAVFAVMAAALLGFLVIVFVGERPARVVSLVLPLAQVSCASPDMTVRSIGGRKKAVTLFGPFAGEWSTNGAVKLVFASEAEAEELARAVQPAVTPSGPAPMR